MKDNSQSEEVVNKSFWNTTIGTITKITALITAISGLILAVRPYLPNRNNLTENNSTSQLAANTSTLPVENSEQKVIPAKHIFTPPEIRDFLDAAAVGNVELLKQDLALGINADTTLNNDPNTALILAVNNNKPDAAKILLENHADPNVKVRENSYLIIEASYVGQNEIVDLLIQHHADINKRKQDGSGLTALMFACIRGNKEIVRKLIDSNGSVDVDAKSSNNSTALDYAYELPSPVKEEILAILNSVGAKSGH
jgi:uncharacterized protein